MRFMRLYTCAIFAFFITQAASPLSAQVFSDDFTRSFDNNNSDIYNGWLRHIVYPNQGFGDHGSGSSTHGSTAFGINANRLIMGELSGNDTAFHGYAERDAGQQSLIDDGTYQFEVSFNGLNAASVNSRPAYYGMAFYKTPGVVDGILVRIHRNGTIEVHDANGAGFGTIIGSGSYPAFNSGTRQVKIELTGGQTLRVRIWDINDPEPATWDATVDISSVAKPGTYIALHAHTTGGDSTDIYYFYDNFSGTAIPTPFREVGIDLGVADTGNGWMVSWADFDGDGDADLHVPNENQVDRLFRNDGGTFVDVANEVGVDDTGDGQGVAWADYDNDGDLDFYLAKGPAANKLFQNQLSQTSTANFVDVANSLQLDGTGASTSAAWADMDLDGDVDLFVTNYQTTNWLFRNDGISFVDIATNPGTGTPAQSNGASWADYDNDGDPDLYMVQDHNVSNALFRNDGNGNFNNVENPLGVADASAGRAAPWADYDGDGDLDLYLAKSSSITGGNALFQNPGDGTAFTNVAGAAFVGDAEPTFGAGWADYDNDGDLDLATANWLAANRLYDNNGDGTFTDRAFEFGMNDAQQGRGLSWADYDNDGDFDLYVANGAGGANLLYRNDSVLNNWLQVDLVGTVSNRSGLGAKVEARMGADTQRQDVSGSTGQTSHETLRQAFGVGSATNVDELTVTWPSGIVQTFTNVAANQILSITEGLVVDVSIPHVTAAYNSSVTVPVQLSNTSGGGIVAAEIFVEFDGDLVTAFSTSVSSTLAATGWSVETNVEQGTGSTDILKIAMATDDDVLVGAGDLIHITFQTTDTRQPTSVPLVLSHVLFNDGLPQYNRSAGSISFTGTDGSIASVPSTVIPRETITITVVDADLDADGTPGTDQVTVSVENTATNDAVNLTLNEDGATAGTFVGTVDTEFGTAAIVDALIQAQAGEAIVATYSDVLDAIGNGPVDRTAQTDMVGGADGSVAITLVSQPGDPLYIQVSDADLNLDSNAQETVDITVENSRTNESFTVTLTEVDIADDVFFGSLPTIPGTSTATEMNTVEDDVVTVTYDDVVTAVGSQLDRTASDDVIEPWGDADDNESLQAFDAAQVLIDVLSSGTHLSVNGRRAANVDLDPVATGITPFDASLVLQKRVGLIASFPVQDPASTNHPQDDPASPKLVAERRRLSLAAGEGYLSVIADNRDGILSGDLLIEGVSGRVEMGAELGSFLSASRTAEDGLRVVFAGAEAARGPGELLRVYGVGPARADLARAAFNDGAIEGVAASLVQSAQPRAFALHPNTPNPFNPSTVIRYELPQQAAVRLEVFDALGQRVRVLVDAVQSVGVHGVAWDGRNASGQVVGNGVYFYRMRAGEFHQMRRMLLLK
jgi:hypothetical protein